MKKILATMALTIAILAPSTQALACEHCAGEESTTPISAYDGRQGGPNTWQDNSAAYEAELRDPTGPSHSAAVDEEKAPSSHGNTMGVTSPDSSNHDVVSHDHESEQRLIEGECPDCNMIHDTPGGIDNLYYSRATMYQRRSVEAVMRQGHCGQIIAYKKAHSSKVYCASGHEAGQSTR